MNEVTTTQPRSKPEIVKFGEQLESKAEQLKMALPSHISPEKFQRTIITAAQSDPELLKCDRQSLVLACMKAAQDGLLPDKREAAIVVFKENKKTDAGWQTRLIATYMPMVYGLRKKILQSGDVVSLEVGIVYAAEVEAGKFLYEVGLNPPLRHRPMLELTLEQTGDDKIVAAYSIATMKDGSRSYEVMRRFEIDRVRETSKTGATKDRQGKPRNPSGPWVDWFPEMAKKTVMRRHSKTLPMSGDIIIDIEGREQEAALSATARLASQAEEPPKLTDESGAADDETPHDRETGEILDETNDEELASRKLEEVLADINSRRNPKTKREAFDRHADWIAAIEASFPELHAQAMAAKPADEGEEGNESSAHAGETATTNDATSSDVSEDDQAQTSSASDDEPLIDKDSPALKAAEEIEALFRRAENIIDLKRYYDDSQLDIASMPEQIAARVEEAYQAARSRLGVK